MVEYSFVQVIVHAKSPRSVLVSAPHVASDEVWVPNNKIHGIDMEKLVHDVKIGDETPHRR